MKNRKICALKVARFAKVGLAAAADGPAPIAGPVPAVGAAVGPAAAPDHVPPAPSHKNFFDDILSDNDGTNVHRLQMLLWTFVFGLIFVHQVLKAGKFPTYDEHIYLLMGLSSTTYVWFKRTEK